MRRNELEEIKDIVEINKIKINKEKNWNGN